MRPSNNKTVRLGILKNIRKIIKLLSTYAFIIFKTVPKYLLRLLNYITKYNLK